MNLPRRQHLLINFIVFQCAWFALVLGAAQNRVMLGLTAAAVAVLVHLWLAHRPLQELKLLLVALFIGTIWDSALAAHDVIRYPQQQWLPWLAPLWIMAMWILFGTTLNVALRFLHGRFTLAALFGAVGAPLSFLAGMRLQALQLPDLWLACALLAIGWGVILPLLLMLARRFDGVEKDAS